MREMRQATLGVCDLALLIRYEMTKGGREVTALPIIDVSPVSSAVFCGAKGQNSDHAFKRPKR